MKALSLSQGLYALVDDDVFDWLRFWKWSVTKANNNKRYARRLVAHPTAQKQQFVYLHKIVSGVNQDMVLSFRDGNPLNVQRENLKITDPRKNEIMWEGSRGESLFVGVVWDKYYGLWRAHIKNMTVGHFVSEIEAVEAYNAKAVEVLGDRAELNNMDCVWRKK
jgi:AP2-like factor (euAP2 lineage)